MVLVAGRRIKGNACICICVYTAALVAWNVAVPCAAGRVFVQSYQLQESRSSIDIEAAQAIANAFGLRAEIWPSQRAYVGACPDDAELAEMIKRELDIRKPGLPPPCVSCIEGLAVTVCKTAWKTMRAVCKEKKGEPDYDKVCKEWEQYPEEFIVDEVLHAKLNPIDAANRVCSWEGKCHQSLAQAIGLAIGQDVSDESNGITGFSVHFSQDPDEIIEAEQVASVTASHPQVDRSYADSLSPRLGTDLEQLFTIVHPSSSSQLTEGGAQYDSRTDDFIDYSEPSEDEQVLEEDLERGSVGSDDDASEITALIGQSGPDIWEGAQLDTGFSDTRPEFQAIVCDLSMHGNVIGACHMYQQEQQIAVSDETFSDVPSGESEPRMRSNYDDIAPFSTRLSDEDGIWEHEPTRTVYVYGDTISDIWEDGELSDTAEAYPYDDEPTAYGEYFLDDTRAIADQGLDLSSSEYGNEDPEAFEQQILMQVTAAVFLLVVMVCPMLRSYGKSFMSTPERCVVDFEEVSTKEGLEVGITKPLLPGEYAGRDGGSL